MIGFPAAAVVLENFSRFFCCGAAFIQLFLGASAAIGLPFKKQFLDGRLVVTFHALHLAVGAVGADPIRRVAHHRAFIPTQAAPLHTLFDDADVVIGAPGQIRVLYPEDEGAAVLASEEPAKQSRANATDVEHSSWGRCETCDDSARHGDLRDQKQRGGPKPAPYPALVRVVCELGRYDKITLSLRWQTGIRGCNESNQKSTG